MGAISASNMVAKVLPQTLPWNKEEMGGGGGEKESLGEDQLISSQ